MNNKILPRYFTLGTGNGSISPWAGGIGQHNILNCLSPSAGGIGHQNILNYLSPSAGGIGQHNILNCFQHLRGITLVYWPSWRLINVYLTSWFLMFDFSMVLWPLNLRTEYLNLNTKTKISYAFFVLFNVCSRFMPSSVVLRQRAFIYIKYF